MVQLKTIENYVARGMERVSSAYVPPLQLTEGQPPPIAANGGLSYMSFDRDGDAGTAAATEAALIQITEGEGQAVIDMLDNAPPGPIETKWGVGFRSYAECLAYIRANKYLRKIEASPPGVLLFLAQRFCLSRTRRVPPERVGRDDGVRRLLVDGVAQRKRDAACRGLDVVRPNIV